MISPATYARRLYSTGPVERHASQPARPTLRTAGAVKRLTIEVPGVTDAVQSHHVGHRGSACSSKEQEEGYPLVLVLALVEPGLPGQVQTQSAQKARHRIVGEIDARSAPEALVR